MSTKNQSEFYDLSKQYDREIAPLVQLLHDKCAELGMPIVVAIQFAQEKVEEGKKVGLAGVRHLPRDQSAPNLFLANLAMEGDINSLIAAAATMIGKCVDTKITSGSTINDKQMH